MFQVIEKKTVQDIVGGIKSVHLWGWMALIEIRGRYRRTVLGPFWNAASMGILVGTLGLVFSTVWKMDITTYLPYLATGFMVWLPISQIVLEGGHQFIGAEPIVKQVKIPFTIFSCVNVMRNMMVMAHYFLVWVVIVIFFDVPISSTTLLFIPGVILISINGIWISMLAGLSCARFRDIEPLLTNIMQIIMFVTPIMWTPEQAGRKGAIFIDFNIVHHFIEIVRAPLLGNVPGMLSYQVVLGCTVFGWVATVLAFSRYRRYLVYWL